jgi:hypothetical protein
VRGGPGLPVGLGEQYGLGGWRNRGHARAKQARGIRRCARRIGRG